MSIGTETHLDSEAVRYHHPAVARQRMVLDERLATVLHDMPIDDLRRFRDTLHAPTREGMASEVPIAKTIEGQSKDAATWLRHRGTRGEVPAEVMLLGTVAVAIAWLTYRATPAPTQSIRQAIETIDDGHPYLLPIPRCDPCFCGSETKFKNCHGRPPSATPTRGGG